MSTENVVLSIVLGILSGLFVEGLLDFVKGRNSLRRALFLLGTLSCVSLVAACVTILVFNTFIDDAGSRHNRESRPGVERTLDAPAPAPPAEPSTAREPASGPSDGCLAELKSGIQEKGAGSYRPLSCLLRSVA